MRKLSPAEAAELGLDAPAAPTPDAAPPTGARKLSAAETAALGLNGSDTGPYRSGYKLPATDQVDTTVPHLPPADKVPGPPPTQGEALGRSLMKGALMRYDDEADGLLSAIGQYGGDESGVLDIPAPKAGGIEKVYHDTRDAHRAANEAAAKEWPKTSIAGEVAGTLATFPLGGTAVKGGTKLVQAGKAIATAAGQGAAAGLGGSNAELAPTDGQDADWKGALRDTAIGGAVGAAVGAGGEAAKAGVRAVAGRVTEGLKRRILNEVAEGTANATPTGRKRLEKAGEAIVAEVTKGPDAKAVRGAYLGGSAEKGRETLKPIIDKVGSANERNYRAFSKAGKDAVDAGAYRHALEAERQAALKAGKTRLAEGIRAFQDRVDATAAETGGLTLTQLRGLTTEAQGIASSVLGSLNEHANAKVARQVTGVVTNAMDDTLSAAAKGSRPLEQAAKRIRANNQRLNALLTVDDALMTRSYKEGTGKGWLERAATSVATPAAAGGALGAFSNEDKLQGALEGAATGAAIRYGLPAAARGITRLGTTAAIKASQNASPLSLTAAEKLARALGRSGAAYQAEDQR